MGRVKAYLGGLGAAALAGLLVASFLGCAAAIVAQLVGWVGPDGSMALFFGLCGAGALVGVVAGIAYRTTGARARRERPRTSLEIRIEQNRRRRRAERAAVWRHWWSDVLPFAVAGVLGAGSVLAFMVSGVFLVMMMLDPDDSHVSPARMVAGVVVALALGVPLIVCTVRLLRGRSGAGGGWSGGGDGFFDGDGDGGDGGGGD